jgi:hypothetical protein
MSDIAQPQIRQEPETAKEVAGKSVGRFGLAYITGIVLIGVGASAFLPESAITAVMTMIGGALVALINLMQGITGTKDKEEKPEFSIIGDLIKRLEDSNEPMRVTVDGNKVTVTKGADVITTTK